MFESLSDKLKRTLKNLRGEGVLTKEHVDAALREIRLALLEADVNYKVAKDFIASVKEKAEGQQVWLELKPSEQVVKIVFDELVELLGGQSSRLVFTKTSPNVVMIVGLQGSGKTTSTGKIARWLAQNQDRKPLLLSTDVYRPAAREQLRVIAKATGQSIFEKPETNDPLELTREALKHARDVGYDTLLIDTAGRLHIDDELMEELVTIKSETHPVEILFVADAMTGQDAVRSAEEFHARIGITGVVLTKMDGDARGGAALSIKQVTGQPVKFVGVGEKYDALEPFYPDRVAQRILGMGDVLSLIEQVQDKVDQDEAEAQLKKLQRNQFTLDDFRSQLRQVKKLGSFSKILKLLPDQLLGGVGMPDLTDEQSEMMEKELKRTEAIIDSMTARRAAQSHDPEREPPPAHRARFGHDGGAGEFADQAVHRNAADDAGNVQRRRLARQDDAPHGRHAGDGSRWRRRDDARDGRNARLARWTIAAEEEEKEETKIA